VVLNGSPVCNHAGGFSTCRANCTELLRDENELTVEVDNSKNDRVYPQKADFTFYGGIYRDVSLMVVSKNHFTLDYFGGPGIRITPTVQGADASVQVTTWHDGEGEVSIELLDAAGNTVATGKGPDITLTIFNAHLWNGVKDPYLYSCKARLVVNGTVEDETTTRFGVRSFKVDPKKGFFLNGKSYPLHGVSRHQDRKGLGNAITREMHDEDMALIKEIGANTIRLAHYQHDQYFYDLCDEVGMVVWAEIPYISEHMPNGRENTISQMKELIIQNYNHPCIVCWGVSNEITISTKDKKDMLDNHRQLNDLCHEMDKTRLTTLACYAMCGPFNRSAHITDMVSWNLYLGWYVPGFILNDLWMGFFHLCFPNRPFGYSEYGAEGMPNLHSTHPHRGDHTEEYQAKYHEYMLRCFKRHPWMWATHVWNMFDFAADARDQGGEPGMNHKGLVTFDRKTKKDSFYLYKAWWSDEAFVHICSKRFVERTGSTATVKVYSNQSTVALYVNGNKVGEQTGEHVFTFKVPLNGELHIQAVAGDRTDESVIRHVDTPNPEYKLHKTKSKSANWV
uniref:glycoside hydrolase family 2 TIM barrel-domain containing protein n=1 Tax=Gemmiger qucibialis TaxID=2997294 RepID=UPI004028E788